MQTEIIVGAKNKTVTIIAPVKDSLHGSMLSDRLDKLPYLKVVERKYADPTVTIKALSITPVFTYERLFNDLDTMSDLIIQHDESLPHTAAGN